MKVFVNAQGSRKILEQVCGDAIGHKVHATIVEPNGNTTLSPFPLGEVVAVRVVEGGLLLTIEEYDGELEDLS